MRRGQNASVLLKKGIAFGVSGPGIIIAHKLWEPVIAAHEVASTNVLINWCDAFLKSQRYDMSWAAHMHGLVWPL